MTTSGMDIVVWNHARPGAVLNGIVVQMLARPRNAVVGVARKYNLVELQFTNLERSDRAGQVQTPGPDEGFIHHALDRFTVLLEALQPVLQCFCVMQSQVFDIQYRQQIRLENCHHFLQVNELRLKQQTMNLLNPHLVISELPFLNTQ